MFFQTVVKQANIKKNENMLITMRLKRELRNTKHLKIEEGCDLLNRDAKFTKKRKRSGMIPFFPLCWCYSRSYRRKIIDLKEKMLSFLLDMLHSRYS
jgi:hypothetical protein